MAKDRLPSTSAAVPRQVDLVDREEAEPSKEIWLSDLLKRLRSVRQPKPRCEFCGRVRCDWTLGVGPFLAEHLDELEAMDIYYASDLVGWTF